MQNDLTYEQMRDLERKARAKRPAPKPKPKAAIDWRTIVKAEDR